MIHTLDVNAWHCAFVSIGKVMTFIQEMFICVLLCQLLRLKDTENYQKTKFKGYKKFMFCWKSGIISLYKRGAKTSIDVNLIQMFVFAVGTVLYLF